MARDYQAEYAAETPSRRKKRASRNRARYRMMQAGRVRKGDGNHVDHRNGNAMDNAAGNIRVMSRAANLKRKRKGLMTA